MFRISPVVARFFPKLAYQLVPAAVVTTVGVLLLSNLAKTPSVAPETAAIETPITAEAVFKITPREIQAEAQEPDTGRSKTVASHAPAKQPSRKATPEPAAPRQTASLPPLQIVPVPEQPQAAVADNDNSIMGRLRSASATVTSSVTGWFATATPPRPPADVPSPPANFQAAM